MSRLNKENKSNNTNSRQQQTMNAAISSTANQMIELDGEKEDCRLVFVSLEKSIIIISVKINDQLHKSGIKIYSIEFRLFHIK